MGNHTGNRGGKHLWRRVWIILACLWIVAASLGPDIPLGEGLLKLRPEDTLTVLMSGLALLKLLTGRVRRNTMDVLFRIVLFALGLGIIATLSLLLQTSSGGNVRIEEGTFGFGQQQELLKEIIRFGKYIVVAVAFSQVPRQAWKAVLTVLMASSLIMIGIQVIQYLAAERINPWLADFYASGSPHASWVYSEGWAKEAGQFRAGSVMNNANVFGAYLIAPFFLFAMLFFESLNVTSKEIRRSRFLWLAMSGIVWLGIFLTQSRAALVAILFGAMVSILSIPRSFRPHLNRVSAWVIVGAVITFSMFASTTYRYSIEGLSRGITEESLPIKLGLTFLAVRELGPLIVVGAGPAGAMMVDTELGYLVTWYGLMGLMLYFVFYHSLYRLISGRIQNVYLRSAFRGILAAYLVGAVGNSFLLNNRVFPVFIALLTVACAEIVRREMPFKFTLQTRMADVHGIEA